MIRNLKKQKKRVEEKQTDEAINSANKNPETVRELADLEAEKQQGLISGVVLSALKEGETFKVGRVGQNTEPEKQNQ